MVGAIGGLLLILALAPLLLGATGTLEPIPRALAVLGAVLLAVALGEAIGSGLGRIAAGQLGRGVLSSTDRAAGGFLGALQAVLIVWLAGGLLAAGPFPALGRAATQSVVVRGVDQVLPAADRGRRRRSPARSTPRGCPTCSWASTRCRCRRSTRRRTPRPRGSRPSAVDSTARITTRACDSQVNGTGVIVAPGYVVTNAHVVAGATAIRATIGSDVARRRARPVRPEPRRRRAPRPGPRRARAPLRDLRPRARRDRRRPRLRGWRLARRAAGRGRGRLRGHRSRHLRRGAGPARDRRAARGRSSRATRAAR